MNVTLKLLVDYQKYLPLHSKNGTVVFDVPPGTQANELLNLLQIPSSEPNVFLINGRTASAEDDLQDGDVVFVFKAMAGG
jgi:hypothetical protein